MTELSKKLTDLQECNREAIHLLSAVQNHGCLLLFTGKDRRVQSASKNVEKILGTPHKNVLGAKIDHLFEGNFTNELAELVAAFPWKDVRRKSWTSEQGEDLLECNLFECDGLFGLEIEKTKIDLEENRREEIRCNRIFRQFLENTKEAKDLPFLATSACRALREITGLDRVMMYQFLSPSWHGQVIAEDRVAQAHSYLDHRFPSSDIPKPARDLYLRNETRVISDSTAEESPLDPPLNPINQRPIDLSDSRLRSVSKIHLEYLRNMGVGASLSFAVTSRGQLWGLIACHHLKPFRLSQTKRNYCEWLASIFSAQGPVMENLTAHRARFGFETRLRKLFESLRDSKDPLEQFFRSHVQIGEIFNSVGMAYVSDQTCDLAGITPRATELTELAVQIKSVMEAENRHVLVVTSLKTQFPEWQPSQTLVSGFLAIQVAGADPGLLFLFRPELVKTVTWGGDPRKQLEKKNFEGQINPRNSFVAWEEVLRDQSTDWQPYEVEGISFLKEFIFPKDAHP